MKLIVTLALIFASSMLYSQSIERDIYFSTAGNYKNTGTIKLQYNIGELMSDSYYGASTSITQGFVQPEEPQPIAIKETMNNVDCSIFPNPVSNKFYVQINLPDNSDLIIELFDMIGKQLFVENVMSHQNEKNRYELNIEKFSGGIYFARIISVKNSFNKTFKITKS